MAVALVRVARSRRALPDDGGDGCHCLDEPSEARATARIRSRRCRNRLGHDGAAHACRAGMAPGALLCKASDGSRGSRLSQRTDPSNKRIDTDKPAV